MRIRHLKWENLFIWPSLWNLTHTKEGILRAVEFFPKAFPHCIHLEAEFAGHVYEFIISLENHLHLKALHHQLRDNVGKTLKEIGNLKLNLRRDADAALPFGWDAAQSSP